MVYIRTCDFPAHDMTHTIFGVYTNARTCAFLPRALTSDPVQACNTGNLREARAVMKRGITVFHDCLEKLAEVTGDVNTYWISPE